MPALLTTLFSERLVQALCWTLIHSLWQGLLLAVLAGMALFFTRHSSAATRYNWLTTVFFLFTGFVVYTFFRQFRLAGTTGMYVLTGPSAQEPVNMPALLTGETIGRQPVLEQMTAMAGQFLNQHAFTIVSIWFCFFVFRCGSMLFALRRLQQLKLNAGLVSGYWQDTSFQLARRMGIQRCVQLLQSVRVQTPLTIGFLKPVILLPASLLTHLTPAETEAVLLHELAHIKRRDYLVNLLQRFVETIFFFNPAVLWLSERIQQEREHCCDDLAIASSGSRKNYLQALVSCQEYRNSLAYAMAFPGQKKNQLLGRMQRIVSGSHTGTGHTEKIFLGICLVMTLVLSWGYAQSVRMQQRAAAPPVVAAADTTLTRSLPAIPAVLPDEASPAATTLPDSAAAAAEQLVPDTAILPQAYETGAPEQRYSLDSLEKIRQQSERDRLQAEKAWRRQQADTSAPVWNREKEWKDTGAIQPQPRVPVKTGVMVTLPVHEPYHDKNGGNFYTPKPAAAEAIIQALKAEGLIRSTKGLSYLLSSQYLIVNNVRQPQPIQEKFKKQFVTSDAYTYVYNWKINTQVAAGPQ
jgi:beta-lactamase regulating signal transducer with metallopeptidase domain